MAIDQEARRQRRVEMFRQVAEERVGKLNLAWIEFEQSVSDPAAFLREAHTLKGEASLTGFALVSKLVHAVEDYVKLVRDRGEAPGERDGDLILSGLDLVLRLTRLDPESPSLEADAFIASVAGLLGKSMDATPGPTVSLTPAPAALPPPDAPRARPAAQDASGKTTPAPVLVHKESSIRVTAEKIDHLRSMVSDLLLSSVRWRQLTRTTRRLREAVQAMRQGVGVGAAAVSDETSQAWTSIVVGLSDMESRLRDETHDLERLIGDLDGTTRELRMIPLATLLDHFPVPLRQLARSLGRQIRFEVEGEQIEVDKALLEMLEEPLLHLLRNAVDHGVEPSAQRIQAGKPAEATIRITAGMVGQRLRLQVSDDGGGIDVEAVRRRALATGLLDGATASAASEQDILRSLFAAGFSTREQVSEVSGRGIGLNIVLDVVENVGGKVDVRSELGRGTTFDIEVPITVAITRVVLFRVGMGTYALPAASVRSLVLASTLEHGDGPEGTSIQFAGATVPLLDLGKVLDEPPSRGGDARIVIAQSGADLVALSGTASHLEREVMLKPMGRFFERLPLVAAAVNLEEGALALVLKAAELVLLSRSRAKKPTSDTELDRRQAAGRIALVADDSPVVRDIVAQALRSYGLHVLVAGDGEEALAVFAAHARVDLVVTDIDMPRLDGLGLVRALRSQAVSKDVPVVAISMRGSEPEKRAAMEAGVSAYIDKSDFNQALLWQTIRPFMARS
jgi:chemotaxis protein histidine kinase CheA/CheY-like chemotaxis protein